MIKKHICNVLIAGDEVMRYTLKKKYERPFLHLRNSIIIEVNNEFINFTGYSRSELIGKSLYEINSMLRLNSQICLENIQDEYSCYMFTRSYEPREVTILCKSLKCKNEKMYFFKEKVNSCIKDKFMYVEQLYENNQIGVSIFSFPDLIMLRANQKQLDFFDTPYNKEENSIGRKPKEILTGYKGSNVEEVLSNVIKTGEPYYAKEGKYDYFKRGVTYWDISIIPIYIEGKAKYIVQTIIEVTEEVLNRKFIDEQAKVIKQHKEELEAIIENMSDFLIVFDKYGKFTKFNKLAKDSLLFKAILLKDIEDVFEKFECYDEYGNLILKENFITERVLKGEKISNYKISMKINNNLIHVEISYTPIYDSNGDFISGILIIRDVTDRVKSQETLILKKQLDLLNNMIENLGTGFVRYSYQEFKIIDINNISYSHLKQINPKVGSLSSIKGENYYDMVYCNEKNKAAEIIKNLRDNKSCSYFDHRKFIVDGEEKFLKGMYQPLFGLNNKIMEIVVITMDITDEVKAKNKIEEALKMQEKIFANVSHELKTPLNVIFSTNQLMEFYLKNNELEITKEKLLSHINIIKQNCYRFTKLINNIVDLSKIESGFYNLNLSNENIVQITEDIVQSISKYIKSKKLSIIFDTNIEEKIIACDIENIERIILNLISNAIKFTNSDGKIFVKVFNKGSTVKISVKDTGIGISKNHLHNIFEKFYQVDKSLSRSSEGSGIGLSLVKSLVELHGGKISVESEVGHGSEFNIELPARNVENPKVTEETNLMNKKIEMINIEFSDIY